MTEIDCSKCRSKWIPEENDIKSSGLPFKQCKKCRKYLEDNRDKIAEQRKDYYKQNKDKIKERNKKWGENNKEWYVEYQKKYNELNKEKIKANKNEKIKCDNCGREITRNNLSTHKRSLRCQNYNK